MEISGPTISMHSDYCSIDDLDSEAREDLEVALYGMLHHASTEEEYSVDPTNNNKHSSLILATVVDDSSTDAEIKSLYNSEESSNGKQLKATNLTSTSPASLSSNTGFKQPEQHFDNAKQTKLTNSNKAQFSCRNSKVIEQLDLKKNPYSQCLIIEESRKPSHVERKLVEVITLSDEEDSKYVSINKSLEQNMAKKVFPSPAGILKELQDAPIILSFASSAEGSESDCSVTVLDPLPGPSSRYMDSSTDSSDSEIEVTKPSKIGYDKVNIELNVNQPFLDSTHVTYSDTSDTSSSSLNWEKYSSEKWTPDMIEFYDKDGYDRDLEATLKSLPKNVKWYLDIEDRRGGDLQRNRYFGRSAKMRCANCHQWDHLAKDCRESRKAISCGICGLLGHKQFACPNKMCLGCGRPSKILIECCPECRREQNIVCMICRSKHVTQRCPDMWRRYHSTTSNHAQGLVNTGNTLKPRRQLFCCNCASVGHIVHECPEKRWSKYVPVNPTIFSYEDPREFLNSVTNDGKSSISVSENRKEIWVVGNNGQSPSPRKEGRLSYTLPPDHQPSEGALQAVRNTIFREIKHIEIFWRKKAKNGRIIVEFSGNGNRKEAKMRFKQLITFNKKAESRNNPKRCETILQVPDKVVKEKSSITAKVVTYPITSVEINHVSREGKHMHRSILVNLGEKEKHRAGKLLAKLEFKNRVQITSCNVGKKWEVTIHKLPHGHPLSAVNSIVNYLGAVSTRPGGV